MSAGATDLRPIVECVFATPSGFRAWFGYENLAGVPISIPIGTPNKFKPNPANRGQPTFFEVGRHSFVFSVPFASGAQLTWKLKAFNAIASAASTRCPALSLEPDQLPPGELNEPYQVQLAASGGMGAKSFTVTGLPPGIDVDAAGLISGIPTQDGSFSVHASVQDAIGQVASRDYTLQVFTAVIACSDDPTDPELVVGGEGDPLAALNRLGTACDPVGVLLRTDSDGETQTTELEKPPGEEPATLDITWEPEPAVLPIPVTQIDIDGPEGNPAQDVQFCDGTYLEPVALEGVPWCLVSQTVTLVGGHQVQITERYFGLGDPKWIRQ